VLNEHVSCHVDGYLKAKEDKKKNAIGKRGKAGSEKKARSQGDPKSWRV
jgi:hypothetical protein